MIYILRCVLDDPRFRGFEGDNNLFDSVVRPRTTRELRIRRLAEGWVPPPVTGRVPAINHYPCINLIEPAFSAHAVKCLKGLLEPNGELLPVRSKSGEFFFYNLLSIADALDVERSTIKWLKEPITAAFITRYEFKPDKLGASPIFRIPEKPGVVYVNDAFVKRTFECSLTGLSFVRIWPVPQGHDWQRSGKRLMVDPSPAAKITVEQAKGNSVQVSFELSKKEGTQKERERLGRFEEAVVEVVEGGDNSPFPVGYLEYSEYVDEFYRMMFSCPDPDALIDRLRGPVKALEWPLPFRLVRRRGNYDNVEAAEEDVKL